MYRARWNGEDDIHVTYYVVRFFFFLFLETFKLETKETDFRELSFTLWTDSTISSGETLATSHRDFTDIPVGLSVENSARERMVAHSWCRRALGVLTRCTYEHVPSERR